MSGGGIFNFLHGFGYGSFIQIDLLMATYQLDILLSFV